MSQEKIAEGKKKALDLVLAQIEKQFGAGSIMSLGKGATKKYDIIGTGSLALDAAIGIGGYPKGRIIEIYGPESSGKSTLASHAVASVQKQGGVAAYIDAEHAFDPRYAANLGVDTAELLVSQPDSGEDALNIAETLARSGAVDLIIIDSVAALVPKSELEGEIGDSFMGLQARMMSQALRKLAGTLSRTNTCAIFINQIREKIGVMFGNPETTTGGKALKFYASIRLDIRRTASIKGAVEHQELGNRVKVKVVKNKVAPPFRVAEFDILFNEGISRFGSIVDLGVELEIIEKKGAWLSYNGLRLGQGKEFAKEEIKKNPQLTEELERKIAEKMQEKSGPVEHVAQAEEEVLV